MTTEKIDFSWPTAAELQHARVEAFGEALVASMDAASEKAVHAIASAFSAGAASVDFVVGQEVVATLHRDGRSEVKSHYPKR